MRRKRPTIKDVADRAGVSISVVSYVLNDTPGQSFPKETRQKILDAAAELDYTPNSMARGMRLRKSMLIGLVSFWDIADPLVIDIMKGVDAVCQDKGYNVVVYNFNSAGNRHAYADAFRQGRIDGVILVAPYDAITGFDEREHLQILKDNSIPAVIINGSTHDRAMKYLYIDYFATSYMATEHLIGLGHRDIFYLMPDSFEMHRFNATERISGFMSALRDSGIDTLDDTERLFRISDVDRVVDRITRGKGPTAIVANKVNYAQVLLEKFIASGISVPDDVSLIACNSLPYAEYLHPQLSVVEIPSAEMGMKSCQLLFDTFEGNSEGVSLMLPNTLIERRSCKAIGEGSRVNAKGGD